MRLLWVKPELLHPVDKGGRIRTYHMLRAIRRRHHVTYATLDDGRSGPEAIDRADEYCQQLIRVPARLAPPGSPGYLTDLFRNLASPLPYAIARYRSAALQSQVERLTASGSVDLVVCDFLVSAVNLPPRLTCPALLFQHNVEAEIWRRRAVVAGNPVLRAYLERQRDRMIAYEAAACRRFDLVVAVSQPDAEHFRNRYHAPRVLAIPTGVDTEYFRPEGQVSRTPGALVFVGSMDWSPNADGVLFFVEEVLPLLREAVAGVTLTVVGRDPGPRLRSLAETHPDITVTGTVPDVRPYLAKAAAMVVPLRVGGGTRLKIFEAMAMETPVVSTTIGAEGLPVRNGEHLRIGDSAAGLADACVRALREESATRAMAREAAALVRRRFGWDTVATEFLAACESALETARRPTSLQGTLP